MGSYFFDKKRIIVLMGFAVCIYMVAFPEIIIKGSKIAIDIWLNSIVPVIMPFFIVAGFLKGIGICDSIPVRIYPLAMAVLSGYPMGAKIAGDYYREGIIDSRNLYGLLSYSMVTGPAFIIGTVGVSMLGSYKLGVILAVSHYGAAMINGLIFGGFSHVKDDRNNLPKSAREIPDYYKVLTDAMLNSFKSVAIILAYIMIFMILCTSLDSFGLFSLTSNKTLKALIKGFMEMTVGCGSIAGGDAGEMSSLIICSFLISFGGLSVLGQSVSMLNNCAIKGFRLFKIKLSHGILSAIIAFAIFEIMIQ